ncbi:hypothetical protein EUGRSUZ_C02451 [Eucalyptus grandis]|uniref:Uncharacterized protein n=2 Tax=Eucalyptus grandis TaxID=71139 RepID=A0A059CSC6_EUCGR|nr:hypothetical protein EUGRSUZ_C02451 [Eucalyptus grandis]
MATVELLALTFLGRTIWILLFATSLRSHEIQSDSPSMISTFNSSFLSCRSCGRMTYSVAVFWLSTDSSGENGSL